MPHSRRLTAACFVFVVAFANAAPAQVDVSHEWGTIFHEDPTAN